MLFPINSVKPREGVIAGGGVQNSFGVLTLPWSIMQHIL